MTVNDHKAEGRVLEMTTWSLGLRCILRQIRKNCVNSQFEYLDSYMTNVWLGAVHKLR